MIIRFLLPCFMLLLMVSSCASIQSVNLDTHVGLYEVVDSKCDVEKGSFDHCKNTLYIEIVRGQFIGIKDSELAYVFWSGYPKIDSELQYTSHLVSGVIERSASNDNIFWLNKNEDTEEYFYFANGRISKYYLKYKSGSNNKMRHVEYTLKPVVRGNLPSVRLNYPGK
ncbi:hypothetical protein ACFL2V_03900 [Pseudomonadota bacterium]